MDNLGKGVGHVGVDGAFERFLTAAIATIITIMFSWRLLAEENENFGDIPPGAVGRTPALMYMGSRKRDGDDEVEENTSLKMSESKEIESGRAYKDQNGICHFDVSRDEKQPEGVMSGQTTSSLDDDFDRDSDNDSSWANYDPDEDMYGEFHTRRSVRDFITTENKDHKKDRYSFSDSDTEVSESIVPTSHEYLEQLYINKEYSSITENEGGVNLNEQIEGDSSDSESESESDEGEFEPPMIDSDEEPYYPSVLEPIIEEDSDDSVENDEKHESSKKLKRPSMEPMSDLSDSVIEPCQGGNLMSKIGIIEADDQLNHVDLFTSEQSTNLETREYENQSEHRNKPPHLDFIEIENQNIDDVEIDDSLPASPIRTCALDDKDGYFSDESCSSSSVITVVSLPTYERRKLNENICSDSHDLLNNQSSIKTDKLVEACLPSQENLNSGGGHVPEQINDDLIAFIHGVPDQSTETNHGTSNLNTSSDNDSIEGDQNLILNVTETTGTLDSVYTQNHKHGSDQTAEKLGKHVGITYNDFVNDLELNGKENFNSETNVSGTEKFRDNQDSDTNEGKYDVNGDVTEEEVSSESPLNTSLDNIDVPDEINNHVNQNEEEETVENNRTGVDQTGKEGSGNPEVYPESDEEPREFPIDTDSDEGPREYNPDEDDFARFNSDLDSDEDSFYLLIGGNENLRKLETFANLNVVGLSPGGYSSDEVTYVDENEKKIVFSRTEEIVTDHSVKCYVKDRENPLDKSTERSEGNDIGIEDKHDKSFEEEQKEILDNLELLLEIDSEKEETLNVVVADKSEINTTVDDIDQEWNVKCDDLSDINSNSVDIDQLKFQVSELLICETLIEIENESETSSPQQEVSENQIEPISPLQTDSVEIDTQLSPDRNFETQTELNSENTQAEKSISGDIRLSSEYQISESVNNIDTKVGVVIDESDQQVEDLIECKTNVNIKPNYIDNKIHSHEEALTLSNSLNHNGPTDHTSTEFTDNVPNGNQCKTSNSVALPDNKINVKNNNSESDRYNEEKLIPISFDKLVDEKVSVSDSEIKLENKTNDGISENLNSSKNNNIDVTEEDSLEQIDFDKLVDKKVSPPVFDFKLVNQKSNRVSEKLDVDKNSKSVEDVTIGKLEESIKPCIDILSHAVQTSDNNKESDKTKSKIPKSNNSTESHKSNSVKESSLSSGGSREIKSSGYKPGTTRDYNSLPNFSSRVVHTSVQRPSGYKGARGKISKQLQYKPKQYSSVLQQPIIVETHRSVVVDTPEKSLPKSRQKILVSRKRFLSEENLSTMPKTLKDPFSQHKASLTKTTPRQRRYVRRDENSAQARRNLSFDRIDRLRDLCQSPRISEDSFEKPEIDNLHADCIFSPHKHEQIMNTTLSIDNLHAQLLRYGSVASLVETDIDSGETFETRIYPETDIDDHDFHFQVPLQRTASMSELGNRTKPRRGRFADRNVPKSKSLQTLETNIDDVFTAEGQGNLTRVPSVHELRVTKSLSKLNVPDWYKKSSVSRSGSTFSLYSSRRDSTSTINSFGQPPSLTTSPCPSVTPGSNAVVIRTRVTPSSAKLVRAPLLPTTPEKSPLPPSILKLPSDKFRQKEQPKQLMPIPIVPFSKLRLMFESKSKKDKTKSKESDIKSPISPLSKSAIKSPTSPEVLNVSKTLSVAPSAKETSIIESEIVVAQKSPTASISPSSTIVESHQKGTVEPVKNGRILQSDTNVHKPQVADKPKSLLVNTVAPQHNTEPPPPPSREHNSTKHVRYSIPSQSQRSPVQNEQVSRRLAPPVAMVQPQSQSRKGKAYDINDNETLAHYSGNSYEYRGNNYDNLQGELLFDFLQKLRYSRLQENVFTDQLPNDLDSENDGHYRFPILSANQHSPGFKESRDDLKIDIENLHVVFADAPLNGGIDQTNLKDTSLEEVLSGLLALNEKKKSSCKNSDDVLFSRKISDESQVSLSPPWSLGPVFNSVSSDSDKSPTTLDYYDNVFEEEESVMVRCKNCRRKSLLKYARASYKTCHNCYTYYCSRHCRKLDWENHKHKCVLSLINSLCKRVIKFVNRESDTQYHFSRAARRGYLSQGRGALVLAFSDIACAENFLVHGVHSLWMPPVFLSLSNLNDAHMLKDSVDNLLEMCTSFNPELKFVLHVVIPVPNNIPQKPLPRKNKSLVQKTAKLRLSPAHMHPEFKENEESSTLILTAVPGGPDVNSNSERRSREVCFVNIQRKLRERGVSLRHHYPEVYDKLIGYVADAKHFTPMIIYPYDNRTRKRFMCVIMPESEPDIEWVQEKSLLDELDINEDFCREGIYSTSISSLTDVPDTPL